MRKSLIAFFALILMLGPTSATAYPTNCFKKKETLMNKTGDWFATLGKQGMEKKRILMKRKHDRVKACAQKNLETGPRGKISGQPRSE
ncbi:MAG: hypothetical protein ABH891_08950 [Candidatus Omnitrophota bacterium]